MTSRLEKRLAALETRAGPQYPAPQPDDAPPETDDDTREAVRLIHGAVQQDRRRRDEGLEAATKLMAEPELIGRLREVDADEAAKLATYRRASWEQAAWAARAVANVERERIIQAIAAHRGDVHLANRALDRLGVDHHNGVADPWPPADRLLAALDEAAC